LVGSALAPSKNSSKEENNPLLQEKVLAQANPLHLLARDILSIKTKKGEMIRLNLNSSQRKLFSKIRQLREERKPIRIWVLKYRQGGVSTEIEAIIYALTSQQPNRNSLIMADEGDKSENLFQMSKLYQERLEAEEPHLAVPLKKSNEKKLEFAGIHSQILIETAENTEAARSYTYQYVHLSECAYFKDLKTVLDALNQSVPDHWDTMIIGETTANGMNEFYKQWKRAEEGKTDWIPLFFAWFEMEEYRLPLQNGQLYPLEGINFDADTSVMTFEIEEQELKARYNLSDEQINWRRWAIVNKCQGDITRFRTEYPSTAEEAFSLSGATFFDTKGLEKQVTKRPIAIGEIFYENLKYQWRDLPHGRIELFERPSPMEEYIVALDASEGIGVDEAAGVVLNKRMNSTAAVLYGQYTPEDLAAMGISIGNYFNNALVVPENKGYGYMVCQLVFQKYGNIYRRIIDKDGVQEESDELGFNTNSVTRPQALAQMNEEIKNNSTTLNSVALKSECKTFVIKKDKQGKVTRVEAVDGAQDGLVICRAIAGLVRQQRPYKIKNVAGSVKVSAAVREAKRPMGRYQ
jgi:hypothetical protein